MKYNLRKTNKRGRKTNKRDRKTNKSGKNKRKFNKKGKRRTKKIMKGGANVFSGLLNVPDSIMYGLESIASPFMNYSSNYELTNPDVAQQFSKQYESQPMLIEGPNLYIEDL